MLLLLLLLLLLLPHCLQLEADHHKLSSCCNPDTKLLLLLPQCICSTPAAGG
jgi:hypothetical protein